MVLPHLPARAADFNAGNLRVTDVWSRPTPPMVPGAVYLSIANTGRKADRLMAISTPIARQAEIHESRAVQGVVEMRAVDSVECPPGATVKIAPGGLHIMLLGLLHPLAAGTEFPLTLSFRDAGSLTVQVRVEARP
jgi:periplasmic copper chaperone A